MKSGEVTIPTFTDYSKTFDTISFSMLTLSIPEKSKNSIFGMPIITQTLNINNLRTTGARSINLHTIRKLVEYSLKNFPFRDIAVRR